ncbi:unnamed protein product, partial [Rotaria sp. Silwood2]
MVELLILSRSDKPAILRKNRISADYIRDRVFSVNIHCSCPY